MNKWVRNGALLTEGCIISRSPERRYRFEIGSFGWPCLSGASVGFFSNTGRVEPVNCVIFYSPTGESQPRGRIKRDLVTRYNVAEVLDTFKGYLTTALSPQTAIRLHRITLAPSNRLNMTDLAVQFHRAMYPAGPQPHAKRLHPFMFKTVVFLPAYGPLHTQADPEGRLFSSSHVGIYSERGRIFMDSRSVPMPSSSSLVDQVFVFCITALPYRPA